MPGIRQRRGGPASPGERRIRGVGASVVFAVLANLAGAGGCAHSAEKVVRRSTPAAIEETLGALSDPANQEQIRRLLGEAAVEEAIEELAAAIARGALDGLSEEERARQIEALSGRLVKSLFAAAGEGLRDELTPSVRALVEETVEAAIDRALGPASRRQAEALAAGVAREAAATLIHRTSVGLREELGPALAGLIEEDLEPALERALAERLIPALAQALDAELRPRLRGLAGEIAREVAKQTVLGIDDALVELEVIDPARRREMTGLLTGSFDRGIRTLELLAWIFAVVAIVLAVLLVRALLRSKHLRERGERSERALAAVARRIRGAREGRAREPWMAEVVALAEEALQSGGATAEDIAGGAAVNGGPSPGGPGDRVG